MTAGSEPVIWLRVSLWAQSRDRRDPGPQERHQHWPHGPSRNNGGLGSHSKDGVEEGGSLQGRRHVEPWEQWLLGLEGTRIQAGAGLVRPGP